MWKNLSEGVSNLQTWANEKLSGERSTAEYYNPINQNDQEPFNESGYDKPCYDSKHVVESRLERVIDAGISYAEKATNLTLSSPTVSNRPRRDPTARDLATDLSVDKPRPSDLNSYQGPPPKSSNPGELTFVFHNATTDTEERVCHDFCQDPRPSLDELHYRISIDNATIAERNKFPKALSLQLFLDNSRSYLKFGDLLEFCPNGKKSKWVIYTGVSENMQADSCIHYSKRLREIKHETMASVAKERPVRRVNHVYAYKDVDSEKIQRAVQSIKQRGLEKSFAGNFNSSEAFAAWLRYQQDSFLVQNKSSNQSHCFKLEIMLTSNNTQTSVHSSLADAITTMRVKQKEGRASLINSSKAIADLLSL